MRRLASTYASGRLAELDGASQGQEPIQVLVEHSIVGDTESEILPSFASLERWLLERGTPGDRRAREARALLGCARGLCTYDFSTGITNGALYLHHVLYTCRDGEPAVRAIFLMDGD